MKIYDYFANNFFFSNYSKFGGVAIKYEQCIKRTKELTIPVFVPFIEFEPLVGKLDPSNGHQHTTDFSSSTAIEVVQSVSRHYSIKVVYLKKTNVGNEYQGLRRADQQKKSLSVYCWSTPGPLVL